MKHPTIVYYNKRTPTAVKKKAKRLQRFVKSTVWVCRLSPDLEFKDQYLFPTQTADQETCSGCTVSVVKHKRRLQPFEIQATKACWGQLRIADDSFKAYMKHGAW